MSEFSLEVGFSTMLEGRILVIVVVANVVDPALFTCIETTMNYVSTNNFV